MASGGRAVMFTVCGIAALLAAGYLSNYCTILMSIRSDVAVMRAQGVYDEGLERSYRDGVWRNVRWHVPFLLSVPTKDEGRLCHCVAVFGFVLVSYDQATERVNWMCNQ